MFTDLLNSSYFALFLIVALGFMLGRIKIKGLSLDVSAVIFIALLFGHFGVVIPKELGNFGLVLFIFTIGIQAGPGFFDSFRSKGKTLILITILIICSASLTAVGLKYLFDIDTPSVVGLIAGALTSTPGLAVAIDSTNSPLASIAYGIAYPFGVIGVILFVKLLPKIMRVDLDQEARRLEIERRGQFPELNTCIFRVSNPSVFNRSLMQINARAMTGAVISRLKHDEEISIPTAHTVLCEGDYIQAVGSEESLDQLSVLVGKREEGELPLDKTQEIESLLLTKKDMINKQLLNPSSIVVVGGSDDIQKPGGKVLKNLIDGHFKGSLYVVNPKMDEVQGIKSYRDVKDLPEVDCAILAIAAKFCPSTVEMLAKQKNTRAFIILSAGFSEENAEGKALEKQIVETIDSVGGALIGPNCIGVLTTNYNGVFTTPIPKLDPKGVDFVSGSGATALFIMDAGMQKGVKFSSVFSVGNSAQLGVEEVLEYWDESFDPETSSRIKLMYVESIDKPEKLLKHASSLIRKGCRIAAIKSGGSAAGSRAASSHTGALASSDVAVEALFRKAGIVRCNGRDELATVAAIFNYPELRGKNMAIVTHAGGPAVMLTDALSDGGMEIPHLEGPKAEALLAQLFNGSSVGNPIDFLATGTAEQLGIILDACNRDFDNIDGIAVIFGSPGLFPVFDVYEVLREKIATSPKPIYPIFPSSMVVKEEIDEFVRKGGVYFPYEVNFGNALCKIYRTPAPQPAEPALPEVDRKRIRAVVDQAENGYLSPEQIHELLDAAGIARAKEGVADKEEEIVGLARQIGFPLVMKVVGPVHKSDVGGVTLNVRDEATVRSEFRRMMQIKDTHAVMLAQQLSGTEVFIGAKREDKFGHMVLCGLGGIFIEVLKDVKAGLAPIAQPEALDMIRSLKSYKIIQGVRGQEPVNEQKFAEAVSRVSMLVKVAPEIFEMDLNPLLGNKENVVAVDARIRIEK